MHIFGEKVNGYEYRRRKGCYAVILDSLKQKVAVILTASGHYFLPGGGMDEGEDTEKCLRREMLEETGYEIKIISKIGEAQSYFFSTRNEPLLSDGMFFLAEMVEKVQAPVDDDHFLKWVSIEEVNALLFHEHQKWAVKKAVEQCC